MYERLNSYDLLEIAKNTGGFFGHIKDASNVGTIFVNAIANMMTTSCMDVNLSVKFNDQDSISAVEETFAGVQPCKMQGGALNLELGAIRFGQNADFLIKLKDDFKANPDNFCDITLTYDSQGEKKTSEFKGLNLVKCSRQETLPHQFRSEVVKHLKLVLEGWKKDMKGCYTMTEQLIEKYKDANDDFSGGMLENLRR